MTNLHIDLSCMLLKYSITFEVFFHWFKFKVRRTFPLNLSNITLLMRPISFLAGFKSLEVGLLWKFSLWSFSGYKTTISVNFHFVLNAFRFRNLFTLFVYFVSNIFIGFFVICRNSIS